MEVSENIPCYKFPIRTEHKKLLRENLWKFNAQEAIVITKVVPDDKLHSFTINLTGLRRHFIIMDKQQRFAERLLKFKKWN